MSFRRSDLQEAFFVPGTHAFRDWLPEPTTEVGRSGAGYGASDRSRGAGTGLLRGCGHAAAAGRSRLRPRPGEWRGPRRRRGRCGAHGAPDGPRRPARLGRRPPGAGLRPERRARRGRPDGDRFAGGGHGGAPVAQARPRPAARQPGQEKWCDVDDVGELKRLTSEIPKIAADAGAKPRYGLGASREFSAISYFPPIFRRGRRVHTCATLLYHHGTDVCHTLSLCGGTVFRDFGDLAVACDGKTADFNRKTDDFGSKTADPWHTSDADLYHVAHRRLGRSFPDLRIFIGSPVLMPAAERAPLLTLRHGVFASPSTPPVCPVGTLFSCARQRREPRRMRVFPADCPNHEHRSRRSRSSFWAVFRLPPALFSDAAEPARFGTDLGSVQIQGFKALERARKGAGLQERRSGGMNGNRTNRFGTSSRVLDTWRELPGGGGLEQQAQLRVSLAPVQTGLPRSTALGRRRTAAAARLRRALRPGPGRRKTE